MGFNKKFFTTGGIVASTPSAPAAGLDPFQNFETVTYTGNGSTQKITGYIRKGAAFNGSSSVIDTGISNSTLPVSSAWSVSVFFYANSNITGDIVLSLEDTTINGWSIYVAWNGSTNVIYPSVNGSSPSGSYGSVANNTWTNVVLTFDGSSTMKMYQDGSLIDTYTSVSISSPTTNLRIGKGGFAANWDGKIDQVRIFNTELNLTQAGQLAAEDYSKATKSTTDYFNDGSGVALYELDEDANDTDGVGGKFNNAAIFNGSSSYIDTGISSLGPTFSVSMWINEASLGSGGYFGNWNGTSNDDMYWRTQSDGSINMNFDGGGTQYFGSAGDITANNWHHIVVTFNYGTINVYADGSSKGSTTTANTVFSSGANFYIGDDNSGTYFNGKIDDVRIYSDVLTLDEVGYIYNNTTASIPTDNLTAYYKLDGDATDERGSYNGTASNVTYTGYNGTPTNVNFLGMAFQPDFVWIKNRTATVESHMLYDSIRTATKAIQSDTTAAESTRLSGLTSFDSNGFTVGSGNAHNQSGASLVAWTWKAGGAAVSNTDGTITSQVSANTEAGFSIGTYSGNSAAGATVGHGLSSTPELIIVKLRSGLPPKAWTVYAEPLGNTKYLYLNSLNDAGTYNFWNDTSPTDSVFSVSSDTNVNSSSGNYVFYAFHSVDGYQRVGSYTGDSSTNRIIYTTDDGTSTGNGGFQPRWVMIKAYESSFTGTNWRIYDILRGDDLYLRANGDNTETSQSSFEFDSSVTNGFRITDNRGDLNQSGDKFLFLAIA